MNLNKPQTKINTILIDCFNTIIIRKVKTNDVFKQWAQDLSVQYKIPWKQIYKAYKKTNFNLCFKKLFSSFTLQENFDIVLDQTFLKLSKNFPKLELVEFVTTAKASYIETELKNFTLNKQIIGMLEEEKKKGTNIYLVSDFYCSSETITYWFKQLGIVHLFNDIFSSCDFEKEKATGKIYKFLIKKLNINTQTTKMYGDNIWSDILMAKKFKLKAKRVIYRRKHENK